MNTFLQSNTISPLQEKINKLYILEFKHTLTEYNELLKETTSNYEFIATIFIYEHMKNNGVIPTDETFKIIERLHSKTIRENNRIKLKWDGKTRLPPRRRIHKIIKGHHYGDKYNNAKQYKDIVEKYLEENPEIKKYERIKMAKNISKNCNISFDDSRFVITNLKRTKKLDKPITNVNKIGNYFDITFS